LNINYFDILREYPFIIRDKTFDMFDNYVNLQDYINLLESYETEKRSIMKIDENELSKLIFEHRNNKNGIFKDDINIIVSNKIIYRILTIKQNADFYHYNDLYEFKAKFNLIKSKNDDFYTPDKEEIINIRRTLIIDKCIE